MREPITVNYVPDGRNWTVTVTVLGREERRTATAPGLIAARDRADQLIEQIEPNDRGKKVVVHLLEGDAFAFTSNYLHARLGLSVPGDQQAAPGVAVPTQTAPEPFVPAPRPTLTVPTVLTPTPTKAPPAKPPPTVAAPTVAASAPAPRQPEPTAPAQRAPTPTEPAAATIGAVGIVLKKLRTKADTSAAKTADRAARKRDSGIELPERRTGVLR